MTKHGESKGWLLDGYMIVSKNGTARRQHILIAEKALGKSLPDGAVVHHANGIRSDNRPENLVICPDGAYHALLHRRMKAQAAGVPLDWLPCGFCKQLDSPSNLKTRTSHGKTVGWHHRSCAASYQREWEKNRA